MQSENLPLKASISFDFGWPTCKFSFFDALSLDITYSSESLIGSWWAWEQRLQEGFSCSGKEYGFNFGNDTPLWSIELGEHMRVLHEWFPFACNTKPPAEPTEPVAPPAPPTDPDTPTLV